jgi:large subunit ribosomal protein L36e
MAASGIAVGINKGHIVTKRVLKAKPSNKIGVCIQQT